MVEFLISLLPGTVQAITVTFTGHPFDTIKTRLQSGMYKNTISCINNTVKSEGMTALYRGVTIPLMSHIIKRSYQLNIYENLLKKNWNPYSIGFIAGPVGTLFGNPLQVIKVNTQSTTKRRYKNALDFIKKYRKREGLKGFYRGFKANLMKDIIFSCVFLGNYTILKRELPDNLFYKFIAGGSAHSFTWAVFIPVDYIKTQVQKNKNNTITSVINKIIAGGSYRTLWRGVIPAVGRIFPVSGLGMLAYEITKKRLIKDKN